ncbi:hypothetical protein GQ53DRAFT_648753 [Thozetella sp. PMI_491]|nr:hypothetical protein GQ53DRAFT_648753 [Thozetella sp. PMI_491]
MEIAPELDLVIIGAGFSGDLDPHLLFDARHANASTGICALIRAKQEPPNARIALFEREKNMGGTWAKNTYPGLACDIPSQLYSYSFALNPE